MTSALVAAGVAAALAALGPYVIGRLPASPDAADDAPDFPTIAGARFLAGWLAVGAAVLAAIVAVRVEPVLLPAWSIACGVGMWLAYVDWRTKLLPTRIIKPLVVALLVVLAAEAWWAQDAWILGRALIAGALSFAAYYAFWWVAGLRSPGSFGFGDVRFSLPLGLVLGSVGGWVAVVGLYLGILLGGVAGLVFKARGQAAGFALGPWMLLGAVLGPLAA